MLEISLLREQKEHVLNGLQKRGIDAATAVNELIALDDKRKSNQNTLDATLAESNKAAKEIGALMQAGNKSEAEARKAAVAQLKENIKTLEAQQAEIEETLKTALYKLPNVPHLSVPQGKSASDNEVAFENNLAINLSENALPHWELAKKHKLIDFELGSKISGAGFPVYLGKGAKLQRALIQFFIDEAEKAGYTEIIPPLLVNEDSGYGTGQLPDKDGQMYHDATDNLYLIPTAEVPLTNLYRDVILKEEDFPIKICGYTPCFRREAGSYGKDVRGLNRLHQFDKVEIVQLQHPKQSYAALDSMVLHVRNLLDLLGLPYRVLRLCGGDMGFTSALTYDLEVYSAAQKMWLEVSSVSNFETFQANRLKLRFKDGNGKTQLAHTLNGSALALPRILAALLENNQTNDGIAIPNCLHKYLNFTSI